MVGSFSFYRRTDGPAGEQGEVERIVPERISSFYCARMPEEKAAGFKGECESILGVVNGRLDREGQDVVKIALIDGARPLWRYIGESPAFEGYRLLLDFYHGSDHLFENNRAHMNYHEHVANGWPIGSGPLEAACKTIVKAHMCQSGMRWSRPGGRSILALRVLIKSRHWDHAWGHYHCESWGHPERC